MNMELRSTGASFVAAKSENNPRDFVAEVISANPSGTRKEQFEEFRRLLDENSDEYRRAVEWYFFVNMHDYMTTSRNRTSDPMQRADAKVKQLEMVKSIKEQIIVLDLVMRNGKAMRDCTGAEMVKFGGEYIKIGKKVGSAKSVGSVLDENQVRQLLK